MALLPKDGIVFRSILITLLAFLIASIGAIGYSSYATGNRASRTIDTRLNQLLDTVQSTVKIACFLNDKDLAAEVATGLLSNSEILQVTILADGVMLADEAKPGAASRPIAAGDPLPILERKIASPFSTGKIVGEVRLTPNPEVIAALRADDIRLAVIQLALQLLLVSLAIVGALIVFVVRPISRMSLELHHMDPVGGDRLAVPPGHEHTEIGRLVQDVNELADHLVVALNEARDARLAAESASEAKSTFLANMSHEIRTPLTALQGFARMGVRDSQSPASKEAFIRIQEAGAHLLGVINDILDFSKIEAGKLAIEARPMRLAELTREAVALVREQAADKGLELSYRPGPNLPEWVLGDPTRIRQILVNLLSNAIKFSRHGNVDLTVLRSDDEIWFAVRDEGIGMTEEEISRLFRPFEQADSSTTRKYGGTGLGLSISMNLASLMGGSIQVVSTPWRGSTFTLQLPLKAIPAPPDDSAIQAAPFELAGQLAGYHILAAEDIEANRLILSDMLNEAGATYIFVENGRAALEQIVAAPAAFDVVLMDIQMPEMDGNEATRRIREISATLPIIGLSAHSLAELRAKSLAAGMMDHVTKPVDPATLATAIRRWSKPSRMIMPTSQPPLVTQETPAATPSRDLGGEVDWYKLDTRFKGKKAFIQTIVRSTLSEHKDAPDKLRNYVAMKDFAALAFLAHTLKGVVGNLAATPCQELAAATEHATRQQDEQGLQLARDLADRITRVFDELERFLVAAK